MTPGPTEVQAYPLGGTTAAARSPGSVSYHRSVVFIRFSARSLSKMLIKIVYLREIEDLNKAFFRLNPPHPGVISTPVGRSALTSLDDAPCEVMMTRERSAEVPSAPW